MQVWVSGRGAVLAAAVGMGLAVAPAALGQVPRHGYGRTLDPDGVPYAHPTLEEGVMTYASVAVGTTSTTVLAGPTVLPRTKLYLLNPSGRGGSGTAVDVWCQYGGTAAVGQGFILTGNGGGATEDMPAAIDQRPIVCIAAAAVTINVGAVQQ